MRYPALTTLGFAAAAGLLLSCSSQGDKAAKAPAPAIAKAADTPLTVERSAQITVTARVKAVNYTTREVTLQDAAGHAETIIAGPQVQRLNEVRVGDDVAVEYVVALVAELRPPTAEEAATPIAAVEVAGRSPTGSTPAAAAAQGVRVVTTVVGVELDKMLVKLRGPMGNSAIVRARSVENIKKLHVGDTIVITYVEAVAISLVKASKP